jgi:hypothetical protein
MDRAASLGERTLEPQGTGMVTSQTLEATWMGEQGGCPRQKTAEDQPPPPVLQTGTLWSRDGQGFIQVTKEADHVQKGTQISKLRLMAEGRARRLFALCGPPNALQPSVTYGCNGAPHHTHGGHTEGNRVVI